MFKITTPTAFLVSFFLRLHNIFLWNIFSFATELEVPDSTLGENQRQCINVKNNRETEENIWYQAIVVSTRVRQIDDTSDFWDHFQQLLGC
jgi:hypothetical protein